MNLNAESLLEMILRAGSALLVLFIASFIIRWVMSLVKAGLDKSERVDGLLQSLTESVVHKVLWVLFILVAAGQVGIDVGPFVAGLGVSGFILGFAFKDALGNLAAGIMISLTKPFQVGHFIETAGVAGTVSGLDLMATTISTGDNKKVIVPNSCVWGAAVTNYSANETRRVDMVVGVAYGADLNKTKDVIATTLKEIPQILAEPAVTIEVVELADSSVNFVVRPWCKTADYWGVHFAAHKQLKEALDAADIEIPFPQLDVHTSQ